MRFWGKLSLILVFFSASYILPPSFKAHQCGWLAWGADVKDFGRNGQDGKNGRDGTQGMASENTTIFADGLPATLNLSGKDGENGGNGENGTDAICESQPQAVDRDLQAPDGGNGGNGGNGGDGGDGGVLTVYATNLANLKQIAVQAAGGKGGQGGQGGQGSKGCQCSEPYWTVETCTGKPGDANYSCSTREFRCRNGRDGVGGTAGRSGRDGELGKLTLIALNKPLESDRASATVPFSQLKDTGFTLSKNYWETRDGASSLFAPGSMISDRYLALVERVERSFLLIWNAPQPFSQFADKRMTLSLKDDRSIDASLPPEVWLEATTQPQNERTELVVYNALLAKEATQLESQGLSGVGTNLQLRVTDRANRSNLVATKFKVKYSVTRSDPRFRPVSDYLTKYEGEVPADLVVQDGNRFTLNIGSLPIAPEALKSGLGVEVELVATRSFAGYSAQQTLVVRDIIGPFK